LKRERLSSLNPIFSIGSGFDRREDAHDDVFVAVRRRNRRDTELDHALGHLNRIFPSCGLRFSEISSFDMILRALH